MSISNGTNIFNVQSSFQNPNALITEGKAYRQIGLTFFFMKS